VEQRVRPTLQQVPLERVELVVRLRAALALPEPVVQVVRQPAARAQARAVEQAARAVCRR
jgi:hypothetical protein